MDPITRLLMQGAAGAGKKLYVEDVFSTWLYTGNGSTQTITNGIDLSGKGGLVWFKQRNGTQSNVWQDTARGNTKYLMSNATDAEYSVGSNYISSFNSDGFSLGSGSLSTNGNTYGTWTFRKAAKFFDVVTYVGDGTSSQAIPHSLESQPGFIIVKRTDSTGNWAVDSLAWSINFMGGNPNSTALLNSNAAFSYTGPFAGPWCYGSTETVFRVYNNTTANISGANYVAYLFASDAGGFGDSGNESVIKCGTYGGGSSSYVFVDLGWEPQWVLIKRTDGVGDWELVDIMRGMPVSTSGFAGDTKVLFPNNSGSESTYGLAYPSPRGVSLFGASGYTYIYIAIRRGPMKTPTDATKVFAATSTATASSPGATATTGFPVDLSLYALRDLAGLNSIFFDRLRGTSSTSSARLISSSTAAEATSSANGIGIQSNTTVTENWTGGTGYTNILWNFRRAPGFFDVVAYTGTGANGLIISHNLGVIPELTICKCRSNVGGWEVNFSFSNTQCERMQLSTTSGTSGLSDYGTSGITHFARPTATQLSLTGSVNAPNTNQSGRTYVAYLFASCPGVSKVGNYTGTGTTQQINCGFTAGARFVLIKRTDSTGDWYVWDSARGIVAGNDPYLLLNSTAAEVTNTDFVDTFSAGFEISSTAPAAINANGGSFIFLAIA